MWMVTFGDAMSLLVAFFVMLVSFADFEEHALQEVLGALKGGLRAVPLPMATTSGNKEPDRVQDPDSEGVEVIESRSVGTPEKNPLQKDVRVNAPDYYLHLLQSGVSVMINQASIFKRGRAELSTPKHEVWAVVRDLQHYGCEEIQILVTLPEHLVVRLDHYTTSWGLGIEQSLRVQQLMLENRGQDSMKISSSINVINKMPEGVDPAGTVEIRYVGVPEQVLRKMPDRILKGRWGPEVEPRKEQGNG
jgi:flagellar motor protein MotB